MKHAALFTLVALAIPLRAYAAPAGTGPAPANDASSPVIVTDEAPPAPPPVYAPAPTPVATPMPMQMPMQAPAPTPMGNGNYERMGKSLRVERIGVLVATVGIVLEYVGLGLYYRKADTTDTNFFAGENTESLMLIGGYGIAAAGLVLGGVSGAVASTQLRNFGVPHARRGMAIAGMVFAAFPLANAIGYILELVHLRKTTEVGQTIPRVALHTAPMLSVSQDSFVVGSRLGLTF